MCRKHFENQFTNKIKRPKMFLNRDFAYAREIIQKSLTLKSGQFVKFIQTFRPGKLFLLFGIGVMHI